MEHRRVDVAIIGAGTAGLGARRQAEHFGREHVLIERGPYGTTCARVGCMPSKLLIAAAEAAHGAHGANLFGVEVAPEAIRVNGPRVLERVRRERDRFVGFVTRATSELPPERRLDGSARFAGPHTLIVERDGAGPVEVEFRTAVIATGSSPWTPPQLDPVRDRVLLNDDVFELLDLPASMAVFGTGVIAIELGQALARLGVRVAFFNPFDVIGPISDPEVSSKAHSVFQEELTLHLGVRDVAVEAHGERGVRIRWVDHSGEHEDTFETVLSAAGRRPNLKGLELERAGVELDARGMPAFDRSTMQIGDGHLFIAGDANHDRPLLHEASDEGKIAGTNAALYPEVRAGQRRTPLGVVFTDPQMAVVGQSYREVDEDKVVVGEVSYDDQGRARVMGKNRGLVRIYVSRECGWLLGAEMLGPDVEHTAHLLAWAIEQRMSVRRALEMPFYHPVVEEGIRTALHDAATKLRLFGKTNGLECGPGA